MKTPSAPPTRNIRTKATAKSMAVVYLIEPPHRVASQLRTLTPEGTAIIMVGARRIRCARTRRRRYGRKHSRGKLSGDRWLYGGVSRHSAVDYHQDGC